MSQSIRRALLSAAVLAVLASPATACIWDSELIGHEKQFKSNYLDQQGDQPYPGEDTSGLLTTLGRLAGGGGVLLLVAGLAVGFVRGRARP